MTAASSSRLYLDGKLVARDIDPSELGSRLATDSCLVWIDLIAPSADDLQLLADQLGLHELAVEDALEANQRPKLDRYPDHLFLSCHATSVDVESAEILESSISCFIGDRWLITVREAEGFDMDTVIERWDQSSDLAAHGVAYLLYGLLDVVVDTYFDSVEILDEYYDEIAEKIFADTPIGPDEQLHWFKMRRALFRLHRLAVALRETVSSLMRREHDDLGADMYPYFQDVYDHVLRVSESTDALRDLGSTIVETNLSLRDYRQNQVMKKVTSWAAILAVPTLITGFYGMNVPYPGFADHTGLWLSLALMVTMSAGLFITFRRKEWI